MHVNKEGLKVLLIHLVVWCLLLALAAPFSRWHWFPQGEMNWYNFWWVGICVLVVSSLTTFLTWRKVRQIGFAQWAWLIGPYLVSSFFIWKTGAALRGFASQPARDLSLTYVFYSCAFITAILLWIVGFPYEEIFGPHSRTYRRVWRVILCAAAAAIAAVAIQHSLQLLREFPETAGFPEIQALQLWIQKITVAVFVFLLARTLLPLTISVAAATFGSRESAERA